MFKGSKLYSRKHLSTFDHHHRPMPSPSSATGLILLSHGSKDPVWRRNAEHLLAQVQHARPDAAVACAYLDWCEPPLGPAVAQLLQSHPQLTHITIWPLLFGVGKHASEDIPALVEELAPRYPQVQLRIAPAMGEDARVIQLLADMAGGYLQGKLQG
ncbi:CbiX/SirB N-terminal domain-containing protein [Comamonas sp. MYb396]